MKRITTLDNDEYEKIIKLLMEGFIVDDVVYNEEK